MCWPTFSKTISVNVKCINTEVVFPNLYDNNNDFTIFKGTIKIIRAEKDQNTFQIHPPKDFFQNSSYN